MGTTGVRETMRELKRAVRSLLRAPGFTATSVGTLAVGLGATAAIVTLVDSILIRPLPYPEAERIVRVHHTVTGSEGANPLARFAFPFLREANRSFEAMGAWWAPARYTLAGEESAERVVGVRATPDLLPLLGARPEVGRLFTAEDAAREEQAGVVLGHRLWERRYGADPAVVGDAIRVDGVRREVLGVMAPGVHLPDREVDLWLPYVVPAGVPADDAFRLNVLARLAPGVTLEAANEDLARLTRRFPEFASFYRTILDDYGLETRARSVREEVVGDIRGPLWIVLGAVSVVLLVAAANVAVLFLVRAEGRRQEVAVRAALGAGRAGLVGHFLAESLCVSLAAGAGGLLVAAGAVRVFGALAPPTVPRLDEVALGLPTVGVVAFLALLLAVGLALYPLLRFGRAAAAASGGRVSGESRARATVSAGLVVAQVALALVLLSGSALLVRTFQELRSVDPGFEPAGVLVAEFSLPEAAYPTAGEVRAFRERLLERVRALPGVRNAALGPSPLGGGGCNGLMVEGRVIREGEFPPCVPPRLVTEAYWAATGTEVVAGRPFEAADLAPGAPPVAVVSANVAQRLWPDGDPLDGAVHPTPGSGPPWFRVVGVVEAVHGDGPEQPASEAVYFPAGALAFKGWLDRAPTLLVRTTPGAETDLAPALRSVLRELDPSVPLTVRGSLGDALARTTSRTAFTLFLLATAAATALVLGLVGLYGVVAYRVGSRRSEIGVRMAMGADAGRVRGMVLGHSLRLVAVGLGLGLVASVLLGGTLSSLLFRVEPGDPWALGLATAALLLTATVAAWLPAQRATRVDPAVALREEG